MILLIVTSSDGDHFSNDFISLFYKKFAYFCKKFWTLVENNNYFCINKPYKKYGYTTKIDVYDYFW
jgi:hypothetical protein